MDKRITNILVANRGEIAVRIMKTAHRMGIRTTGVYSRIDAASLHVPMAGKAVCIGESELAETYLSIPKIIQAALDHGCDAIHPGYGFLAENPAFVRACNEAGIIFIGPGAEAMHRMGNKIEARSWAKKSGVPITEGMTGTREELLQVRSHIDFPVLLKAAAGGGGKGMRIVYDENDLEEALESTARQAKAYFGDETVYIEKYLEEPRHIEIQLLADNHGNAIHLFERECSIQRRYQKIIEESPSPTLTPDLRRQMGDAAVKIAREIGYSSAGTIEFLVDRKLQFYFLEMNTRIQVEHPVTEMVTGIDIVEEQIRIARGEVLRYAQEEISQKGHAIECRIYAEDPENNFLPSPGFMTLYQEPRGEHIRTDTGVGSAMEIKSAFDPMISKLVVWGENRNEAAVRMQEALSFYGIHGIRTNISYLRELITGTPFLTNTISTKFCDSNTDAIVDAIRKEKASIERSILIGGYLLLSLHHDPLKGFRSIIPGDLWYRAGMWRHVLWLDITCEQEPYRIPVHKVEEGKVVFDFGGTICSAETFSRTETTLHFRINGIPYHLLFSEDRDHHHYLGMGGHIFQMKRSDFLPDDLMAASSDATGPDLQHVTAPMPGKVIKIDVGPGDQVKKGEVLMIIEAMKMENNIIAGRDARVKEVNVKLQQLVEVHTPLVVFEEE